MQVPQNQSVFMVVNSSVLPEIFAKVLEAKRYLARGEERSSAAACKRVGISRSAFYKYKDCVFHYEERLNSRILSLYTILRDEPGVLSGVLSALHRMHANILTVNQNIPIDGVASVTISIRLSSSDQAAEDQEIGMVQSHLAELEGVVDVRLLTGA